MSICQNCGKRAFNDKLNECRECNYKNIESKTLEDATLIFCGLCGHTYLNACDNNAHTSHWKKVKI
jgi:hypothetical protein